MEDDVLTNVQIIRIGKELEQSLPVGDFSGDPSVSVIIVSTSPSVICVQELLRDGRIKGPQSIALKF